MAGSHLEEWIVEKFQFSTKQLPYQLFRVPDSYNIHKDESVDYSIDIVEITITVTLFVKSSAFPAGEEDSLMCSPSGSEGQYFLITRWLTLTHDRHHTEPCDTASFSLLQDLSCYVYLSRLYCHLTFDPKLRCITWVSIEGLNCKYCITFNMNNPEWNTLLWNNIAWMTSGLWKAIAHFTGIPQPTTNWICQ